MGKATNRYLRQPFDATETTHAAYDEVVERASIQARTKVTAMCGYSIEISKLATRKSPTCQTCLRLMQQHGMDPKHA
jgi:hypothetical protein